MKRSLITTNIAEDLVMTLAQANMLTLASPKSLTEKPKLRLLPFPSTKKANSSPEDEIPETQIEVPADPLRPEEVAGTSEEALSVVTNKDPSHQVTNDKDQAIPGTVQAFQRSTQWLLEIKKKRLK